LRRLFKSRDASLFYCCSASRRDSGVSDIGLEARAVAEDSRVSDEHVRVAEIVNVNE
jgi:hypothetical protein